jgi:hypothetical protein
MDVTGQIVNFSQTANRKGNIASVKYLFESSADNLTALAGGGQSGATQIGSEIARFTTVATSGDSAMLPPALEGLTIMVTNHGSKPMQVYGAGTDTINDQSSSNKSPQPPTPFSGGKTHVFGDRGFENSLGSIATFPSGA